MTGNIIVTDDSYIHVGGIANSNSGIIRDSIFLGSLKCNTNNNCNSIVVSNTGVITNSYSSVSNINPIGNNLGTASNVFHLDHDDTNSPYSLNFEDMKLMNSYTGFDFVNTWDFADDGDYLFPILKNVKFIYNKEIFNVELNDTNLKKDYIVGFTDLDLSGGKLKLFYNNGEISLIDINADMVSYNNINTPGNYDVTLIYETYYFTYQIEVINRLIENVVLENAPLNNTFVFGEDINFNGGVYNVIFNDGSVKIVDDFNIEEFDPFVQYENELRLGNHTVEYCLKNKDDFSNYKCVNMNITIIELEIVDIEVINSNCNGDEDFLLTFYHNDDYIYTYAYDYLFNGIRILEVYNNGDKVLKSDGFTIGDFDISKLGLQDVEVEYKEFVNTFEINVVEPDVDLYIFNIDNFKTTYDFNEELDLNTLKILHHLNGMPIKEEVLFSDELKINGYDKNKSGIQNVTFSIGNVNYEIIITVLEEIVVEDFKSDHYVIDDDLIISKIPTNQSVVSFMNNINTSNTIRIYRNGHLLLSNDLMTTGSVVKVLNGVVLLNEYKVLITGDTSGDGKISVTDMINVKSHLLSLSTLTGVYSGAGDVNGDGVISITDFIQLKAHILGINNIEARSL